MFIRRISDLRFGGVCVERSKNFADMLSLVRELGATELSDPA